MSTFDIQEIFGEQWGVFAGYKKRLNYSIDFEAVS